MQWWWAASLGLALFAVLLLSVRVLLLRAIPRPAAGRVPIAVLGNSDSHSYGDRIWFPVGSAMRGGASRAVTLQWTELLAQLRADAIDPGPWGRSGHAARLARVLGWFGLPLRTPRKEDYAFNLATSGARCEHLVSPLGQLTQLRRILARDREAWGSGAVVIRIGINDIGGAELLDSVAQGSADSRRTAEALRASCLATVAQTLREIRAEAPALSIVLVGIADNTNWPPNAQRWMESGQIPRIREFIAAYDAELARLAAATPRTAFLDDRAWFRGTFGERTAEGVAAYRVACVGPRRVAYRQGDDLGSAILADGHAGTMLNLLWVPALVDALRRAGVDRIAPIESAELTALAEQLSVRAGTAAAPTATDCGASPS